MSCVALGAAALLAAVACAQPLSEVARAEASPSSSAHRKLSTIGLLMVLSGSYSVVGADNQQGIAAAMAELGEAAHVTFVTGDTRADPTQAISEFRRMVAQYHPLAFYVMRGPPGMAVNPISKMLAIPLLGGVGNSLFATDNPYAIQAWPPSSEEGAYLAKVFAAKRLGKIALVTVQDDWPIAVTAGLKSELSRLSWGAIVMDKELAPSEVEFGALVSKLKEASPDVVFLNLGLSQIAPFLKQARIARLTAQLYSNFWAGKKEVIAASGLDTIEGLKYVEMDTDRPALCRFLAETYNSSPSGATLSAYASILLLNQGLRSAPDAAVSTDSLYRALLRQSEIRTRDGPIAIRDRVIQFPLAIKTIRNGKPEREAAASQ